MARPATQPKEDTRLLRRLLAERPIGFDAGGDQSGESQRESADSTRLKKPAPRIRRRSHRNLPKGRHGRRLR
jgi:hypothetical protein